MVVDLPAPFGPEEPVHLTFVHAEVESVEGSGAAEGLDEVMRPRSLSS